MPEDKSCPAETFEDRPRPKAKIPLQPESVQLISYAAVIDRLDDILDHLKKCRCVYLRAATKPVIKQLVLSDATKYVSLIDVPPDALSWELWNSDLGTATGMLYWGYRENPGDPAQAGSQEFNVLEANNMVIRGLAGVTIYVRPENANQIVVIEVLRL